MADSNSKLAQIEKDVQSEKQYVRGKAMQDLYMWVKQDTGIHRAALPIFRAAMENVRDGMTGRFATMGIELVAGAEAAKPAWVALLNHPNTSVVSQAALTVQDRFYVPVLVEVLATRQEEDVRVAIIRALGRRKDPALLGVLVKYLEFPNLRPHVVEALGEIGDARAIAYLEPLLKDKTEAWEIDNHGPMLRVCDLAKEAMGRLGRR